MFSEGDRCQQLRIATELEAAGLGAYLPQRDGIEVRKLMALLLVPEIDTKIAQQALEIVRRVVFALDIYQLLERCTCVVFNLDGRVPDEGSVVETSIAYAAGKPIVFYKTTPITFLANQDNPMVQGLSYTWVYCSKIPEIPLALQAIIDRLKGQPYRFSAPPQLSRVIDLGRNVAPPASDFRNILANIVKARDALAETNVLLDWANNSKEYHRAF